MASSFPVVTNQVGAAPSTSMDVMQRLSKSNETIWLRVGVLAESMNDLDKALYAYENVLRHNPYNTVALAQSAAVFRCREQYPKAIELLQRALNIENNNGEYWASIGHCYLMLDDIQKAYGAYQQALYYLPNPKDPNLWYGIGILYERFGSLDHAAEALEAVLKMDSKFDKSNEIYFRLGVIYKQQSKQEQALECFRFVLRAPPAPLTAADIWFQIGFVHETQKEMDKAYEAYENVLKENAAHPRALRQLGWLSFNRGGADNQETAVSYLLRSLDTDKNDAQTWYLLGRCYMAQQQYRKAFDAFQQAVNRDGRNPVFWCSIGVLYYQINQYRDALDAYMRAIYISPYIAEVWYDMGTLYESCNQLRDALNAYQQASELDPNNAQIKQRIANITLAIKDPAAYANAANATNGTNNNNAGAINAATAVPPQSTAAPPSTASIAALLPPTSDSATNNNNNNAGPSTNTNPQSTIAPLPATASANVSPSSSDKSDSN